MRKGLSPEIERFIELSAENKGFSIKEAPTGTFIEVTTRSGSTYLLVVSNPAKQEIVLTGPHDYLREPRFYCLQGSTGGGSLIRVGWVGIGQCLSLAGPEGRVTTTPVVSFQLNGDPVLAQKMLAEAERHRPKPFTEEDAAKFEDFIDGLIAAFPENLQDRARELIFEFNREGQAVWVQIFRLANERGKLKDAIDLLRHQYRKHWAYRAPEIRGSFITSEDEALIIEAYEKLGLPMPKRPS